MISCFAFGVYAQSYYSEDFESSISPALPTNATSIDQDGDTYGWETSNGWAAYAPFETEGIIASSRSWTGTAGGLNPDNYMVLGPIDLSSYSNISILLLKLFVNPVSKKDTLFLSPKTNLKFFNLSKKRFL